ncbi:ATP12 family protein [Cereibacter sp. SYSU M97828]|nr:ATP12 family protein [Cereibacter flavus]
MSGWAAKRFWKDATVTEAHGGFSILLDGRGVKTPAKTPLTVPTRALAEAMAAEWQAQEGTIRPDTMPLTRAANSAIDKVVPLFDAVVGEVAGFGASDLLCYRGEGELAGRQRAWDALLDWSRDDLGAPLHVTTGIVPVDQPVDSVATLRAHVAALGPFELVALHDLVAISGSLVLGLAVHRGRISAAEAFALSRIDEAWQAEKWGVDEDAAEADEKRLQAFLTADRFLALCR